MSAKSVPFHITSGIPFAKTVAATLPTGRTWWTSLTEFEVLCQIRETNDVLSPLIVDIAKFLTVSISGDVVTIELQMSGTDTRLLTKDGYYDMVISDTFAVDDRAMVLIEGPVKRSSLTTAETEDPG